MQLKNDNENRKFRDESMSSNVKTKEVIQYKGDLRIVGLVVESLTDKEPIGYVIMVERTYQFKMYSVEQTRMLLSKYKFVNAELKDDKIVNTECAMDRLMKFDTHMEVIGNRGMLILAEIESDGKSIGYRAMDESGRIVDTSEENLIKLMNAGTIIANAKTVKRGKGEHISAIKQTFTKVEKSKINDFINERIEKAEWRKQKRREKMQFSWAQMAIRKATGLSGTITNYWDSRHTYVDTKIRGNIEKHINLELQYKILVTEILPIYVKTDEEKALVKEIYNKYHKLAGGVVKYDILYPNEYDNILAVGLLQFLLNDDNIMKDAVLKAQIRSPFISDFIDGDTSITLVKRTLIKEGLACKSLLKFIEFVKIRYEKENKKALDEIKRRKEKDALMWKLTSFKSAKEIAELGFAISEANDGFKYKTSGGRNLTLKYIGKYIPNYDKYKGMATCFGDVAILANIERTLQVDYFNNEEVSTRVEVMLAILSMYNPAICKEYIKDNYWDCDNVDMLPGVDLDNQIDYKLSPELKLYYESGFNVFLNDNKMNACDTMSKSTYRKACHIKSKYINYRALGNKRIIKHNMLYKELASVVALITSDKCKPENIESVIGRLRIL